MQKQKPHRNTTSQYRQAKPRCSKMDGTCNTEVDINMLHETEGKRPAVKSLIAQFETVQVAKNDIRENDCRTKENQ